MVCIYADNTQKGNDRSLPLVFLLLVWVGAKIRTSRGM